MKIAVIHPKACTESARELAEALTTAGHNAVAINPRKQRYHSRNYDFVFNYGLTEHNGNVNEGTSVHNCVNKLTTFRMLQQYPKIPIPKFTEHANVAALWDVVVCRDAVDGRANEGMSYWYPREEGLPKGALFTEYFSHHYEYRIVVFKGKVVGRYRKDMDAQGDWNFTLMTKKGFKDMDRACIRAAEALQIDYVGMDVLENARGSYVVLEANSGPVLTEEVKKAIVKYIKQLN